MKLNKVFLFIFILFFIQLASSVSNESLFSQELLEEAEKNIQEMEEREIPVNRVNELYSEASQLYLAQTALEEKGMRANYKLVIEYTSKISSIKDDSIEAKDELRVFIEVVEDVKREYDLSSFEEEYQRIVTSFSNERFEDTLILIPQGYDKISEIQSTQTATRAFYDVTSRTIKKFLIDNWKTILITLVTLVIVLLIFWNRLTNLRMRIKMNHLLIQKKTVNELIKKMQKNYFKDKKQSESEYKIKLKKYEELLREIERQLMVLRGELFRRDRKKKSK